MKILTIGSLAGGQGKTTAVLLLARKLSESGQKVLAIDSDPQGSLTLFGGLGEVEGDQPSLLEFIKGEVVEEAIYPAKGLSIIPSDRGLGDAEAYLTQRGQRVLKTRLNKLAGWDYCLIDTPPEALQLTLNGIAAADLILIPAEAGTKGAKSLVDTLDAIAQLSEFGMFNGQILGCMPTRDAWYGYNQASGSKEGISIMRQVCEAEGLTLFPSLLSSQKIVQAIENHNPVSSLPENLTLPIEAIAAKLLH